MSRSRSYEIGSFRQLVDALRRGRRLTKTYRSRGPVFDVHGKLCDPGIANVAIARGLLRPVDAGLFDKASAQSWELKERTTD